MSPDEPDIRDVLLRLPQQIEHHRTLEPVGYESPRRHLLRSASEERRGGGGRTLPATGAAVAGLPAHRDH